MTHSCTCIVVAMTWRRPSLDFSSASRTLTIGCRLIGWNLTRTRPSYFGLLRGTPCLWEMTSFHPCSSERPSSHLVNMFECFGWFFFRLTSASRSICPTSAGSASTICVDYGTYGVHWPRTLPRHSCTPSWRPALTTVSLSSLGSKDHHQQVAASVELGSSYSQRYTKVRSRSEAVDTFWAPLAWHTRACQVQTRCHHTPMSVQFWLSSCVLRSSLDDCL